MAKKIILCFFIIFHSHFAMAQELRSFLKNCAGGTAAGATAGLVSLAFTNKPSESWSNVAKGASLGLYAGIGYGTYRAQSSGSVSEDSAVVITPEWNSGKISGVRVTSTIINF